MTRSAADADAAFVLSRFSTPPLFGKERIGVSVDSSDLGVEGVFAAVLLAPHPQLLQHPPRRDVVGEAAAWTRRSPSRPKAFASASCASAVAMPRQA